MGIAPETVQDLWAHAREESERAERELEPAAVRRALVVLAVAGSGGDPAGFRAEVRRVMLAARKVGMDPVPLFDAAAALVDRGDVAAREALITSPREVEVRREGCSCAAVAGGGCDAWPRRLDGAGVLGNPKSVKPARRLGEAPGRNPPLPSRR